MWELGPMDSNEKPLDDMKKVEIEAVVSKQVNDGDEVDEHSAGGEGGTCVRQDADDRVAGRCGGSAGRRIVPQAEVVDRAARMDA